MRFMDLLRTKIIDTTLKTNDLMYAMWIRMDETANLVREERNNDEIYYEKLIQRHQITI